MKKAVLGLVGIVVGYAGFIEGCQSTINEEATKIRRYSNEIKKIVGAGPEDSCQVIDTGEKEPLQVIIKRENETELITYLKEKSDGEYDRKDSITIPKKLDIKVLPEPNNPKFRKLPEKSPKDYSTEKKKKLALSYP